MALRTLMLKKDIDNKRKAFAELEKKDADFEARNAELEAAIAEVETEEQRDAVNEEIEKFEAEKAEHDKAKGDLDEEIRGLEAELDELEKAQAEPAPVADPEPAPAVESRKDNVLMETRKFFGMNMQERDAFFANDEVRSFLDIARNCIKEQRTITNVGLTIPEVMLPLLRQVAEETSKLVGRVYHVRVAGTGRMNVMGAIPEAVWTEMCANLNELDLAFNDVEVDGYKVGGYFAVCNAILEDSDIALASEIINALGKSIGIALDKAIVYGTGTKMPLGIVTRLAQSSQPADYSATSRTWADLHSTHITKVNKTGLELFQEIVKTRKIVKNNYFENGIVWVMNASTHTDLIVQSMGKDSSAAVVAGMSNSMPVIGGDIVELPFMADGDIVYGYFDAYLLAERAGTQIDSSEHVRFLADQTVFKGTARYDGTPVIAEAFGIININNTNPTTTATFAPDTANTADSE